MRRMVFVVIAAFWAGMVGLHVKRVLAPMVAREKAQAPGSSIA